jgi:hypothetical protein
MGIRLRRHEMSRNVTTQDQGGIVSASTYWESFKVKGTELLEAFKRLVHEGNVRRVVIKHEGRSVVEFPLTVGVVGVALAPMLAAVGGIAALVTECTIEVERTGEKGDSGQGKEA